MQRYGVCPPSGFATSADAMADVESRVGKLGVRRAYAQLTGDWTAGLADDKANGRLTVLSVKPASSAPTGWRDVTQGRWDAIIRAKVAAAVALNPLLGLSFHHEPIDDTRGAYASDFVAASRHFYEVVKTVDSAIQVGPIFMLAWDLNKSAVTKGNLDPWWPGSDHADFVGGDPYQGVGPTRTNVTSAASTFGPCIDFATRQGVPLWVCETGIADNRPDVARVDGWVDALGYLRANSASVPVVTYFDTNVNKIVEGVGYAMSPGMEAATAYYVGTNF